MVLEPVEEESKEAKQPEPENPKQPVEEESKEAKRPEAENVIDEMNKEETKQEQIPEVLPPVA